MSDTTSRVRETMAENATRWVGSVCSRAPLPIYAVAIGLFLLLGPDSRAAVPVLDAGLGAVTGLVLLDKAESVISNQLNHADQIGRGLVDRGVTGLSVTVDAMRISFDSVLTKRIDQMSEPERAAFSRLNDMIKAVQNLAAQRIRS
jgi:hypothetical protein